MKNSFHSFKIKQLNNKELLSQTKQLVQKERETHIQVLYHLNEIESRKLYLKLGFSSLFDYTTKELGYSEGAAYRRIKAMKLCQELPGTKDRLQSGRISLSSACQLQVFFEKKALKAKEEQKKSLLLKSSWQANHDAETQKQNSKEDTLKKKEAQTKEPLQTEQISQGGFSVFKSSEKSTNAPFFSQEDKEDLVKRAEGRSIRATLKLLSETDPSLSLQKEQTRLLGKGKVEIKIIIDEKCHKELEELKNLLSHKNPNLSYGELLSILSEEALKKHDPRKRTIRQKKTSAPKREQRNEAAKKKVTPTPKSEAKDQDLNSIKAVLKRATSAPKSKQKPRKISRTIPFYLRKYIWERDKGQCTYIHHATKRRCGAIRLLQIDHIQPFALGGKTEKENLRLLCAAHNQYRK